jgi:hypothetical protein
VRSRCGDCQWRGGANGGNRGVGGDTSTGGRQSATSGGLAASSGSGRTTGPGTTSTAATKGIAASGGVSEMSMGGSLAMDAGYAGGSLGRFSSRGITATTWERPSSMTRTPGRSVSSAPQYSLPRSAPRRCCSTARSSGRRICIQPDLQPDGDDRQRGAVRSPGVDSKSRARMQGLLAARRGEDRRLPAQLVEPSSADLSSDGVGLVGDAGEEDFVIAAFNLVAEAVQCLRSIPRVR